VKTGRGEASGWVIVSWRENEGKDMWGSFFFFFFIIDSRTFADGSHKTSLVLLGRRLLLLERILLLAHGGAVQGRSERQGDGGNEQRGGGDDKTQPHKEGKATKQSKRSSRELRPEWGRESLQEPSRGDGGKNPKKGEEETNPR